MVAQWDMDSAFGDTMEDSSGNANNGTTHNIVVSAAGYVFDGGTSKVVVPNSPTLNPGAADFSFSVQIQTSVVPARDKDYDLLRKGNVGTKGGEYKIELINVDGKAKALCVVKDSLRASQRRSGEADRSTWPITNCIPLLARRPRRAFPSRSTATSASQQGRVSLGSISNTLPLLVGVKTVDADENDLANGDWYNGVMRSATVTVEP